MLLRSLLLMFVGLMQIAAQEADVAAVPEKSKNGKPALIAPADLSEYAELPADRRKLIDTALSVARDSPWLPYTVQGSKPEDGGFDCSGAIHFVLRKAGLNPPRISGQQCEWVKSDSTLHPIPADAVSPDHPSLQNLHPGDLLFWGRKNPAATPSFTITHVALYLGTEKKDGRPVMINSTDGRSYRGTKANGYGVYDFRLPQPGAAVSLLGYGTPPGITPWPATPTIKQKSQ
ncbi:MAG: C40 family peptidase [Akkermansiaceae bacterium]|nr:C40 family peptidase [Akkermansiaceae bacterium]